MFTIFNSKFISIQLFSIHPKKPLNSPIPPNLILKPKPFLKNNLIYYKQVHLLYHLFQNKYLFF
jgi:hypothetical protein